MRTARTSFAVSLACVIAWPRAAHAQARLQVDALGGYRGYGYDSDWMHRSENVFEQELRAALNGYLLYRSVANYHLGIALDHQGSTWEEDGFEGRTSAVSYTYDAWLSFWERGLVPVTAFASRQNLDLSESSVPTYRTTSDIYGGSIGLAPQFLPRLDFRGYHQDVLAERSDAVTSGEVSHWTATDLYGSAVQVTDDLVSLASIERRTDEGPTEGYERGATTGSVMIDYRANDDLDVVVRARDRTWETTYDESSSLLRSQASDAAFRYDFGEKTTGRTYYVFNRTTTEHESNTGGALASSIRHEVTPSLWTTGLVGASVDTIVDVGGTDDEGPDEVTKYAGENAEAGVEHAGTSAAGGYQVGARAGVAQFSEVGEGDGVQASTQATAGLSRSLAANVVQASLLGDIRRQWDASPVDLDLWEYGAAAALQTARIGGVDLTLYASERVVDQLSQDEGNSDRFRVYAVARAVPAPRMLLTGTSTFERNLLDDEFSRMWGTSARFDAQVHDSLVLGVMYFSSNWRSSELDPWWWRRAEAIAQFRMAALVARARYARSWTGSDGDATASSFVWVEVVRSFGWDL